MHSCFSLLCNVYFVFPYIPLSGIVFAMYVSLYHILCIYDDILCINALHIVISMYSNVKYCVRSVFLYDILLSLCIPV